MGSEIRWSWVLAGLMVLGSAQAADTDTKAGREREMLRRTQEALRQSQAESADLTQQKTQAEQKLKAAAGELESLRTAAKSAQSSLRGQLQAATAAQDDLTRQLEDAKHQLQALTAKQQETESQLNGREAQLKQTQQELVSARSVGASCEAKNLKLYEYSQDILMRYEKKGVWASLRQKEPVLGLGAVGTENVVQEYREKVQSQRLQDRRTGN